MKKYIISIFLCLYFTISYSQFGVGIGYEVSGNSDYNSALKVNLENLSFNNILPVSTFSFSSNIVT